MSDSTQQQISALRAQIARLEAESERDGIRLDRATHNHDGRIALSPTIVEAIVDLYLYHTPSPCAVILEAHGQVTGVNPSDVATWPILRSFRQ
jgi:hypothetical protein